MPDAPTAKRTRIAAAAGVLGASAVIALLLGVGPAPSALQLAGASSDDPPGDISGSCDEVEHAADPACGGAPASDGPTSTVVDDVTATTAGGGATAPDDVRSLDAAGAGTVIYAIEDGSLRLVTATPASGWVVEVEQGAGREVELDFRSGTRRVQVNIELEDGEVRERVRVRDDADDTDVRTEDGVVQDDSSGPGSGGDDSVDDDHSGSGHGGDDTADDDHDDDDTADDDHDDEDHDDDRSGSNSGPG